MTPRESRLLGLLFLGTLALGWLGPAPVSATAPLEVFSGRVVGISDGDTLSVMRQGESVRIRLEGIDAPERGQDFGRRATQALSELAHGKNARVEVQTIDRYGRRVARVIVEGVDTSEELVRRGLAWHYTQYSSDAVLARLEREAREARRGLWSVANPQPPWEFRRVGAQTRGAATGEKSRESPPATAGPFNGNTNSRVFHRPGCQHYNCKNCTRRFATREAAIQAGYRPGGCCRP